MTRKPKIDNLTNMTELYAFLESIKWHLLFNVVVELGEMLPTSYVSCMAPLYIQSVIYAHGAAGHLSRMKSGKRHEGQGNPPLKRLSSNALCT